MVQSIGLSSSSKREKKGEKEKTETGIGLRGCVPYAMSKHNPVPSSASCTLRLSTNKEPQKAESKHLVIVPPSPSIISCALWLAHHRCHHRGQHVHQRIKEMMLRIRWTTTSSTRPVDAGIAARCCRRSQCRVLVFFLCGAGFVSDLNWRRWCVKEVRRKECGRGEEEEERRVWRWWRWIVG